MRRGDLVTVSVSGDFGKPRPALVIQSDYFSDTATVTVLLLSGTLVDAPFIRLTVQPSSRNGLTKPSQVMIDKSMTIVRDKIGPVFGRLEDDMMLSITRSMAVFVGVA
ncbi:type II toxin-antitoxin system PemK/MazF family toxin [Agrobacterium rubi]|uniref:Type II toxin-antitoxin system PemK/MazF family toxin n=1 Tax=Agrobacterium rubi TaxID=28099 RepID=A0AAE7RC40_9HYPH|nr:type II toxin-antitoxin system PemK/MazF family toxin [Agrobacterium rubi]NTE86037.1 type II toxin-antitoxin system PemK/MazF family toxin [Agrobacterium rubi]NTF01968.1 type II toxin-antitoxin system PemK/MazF family toxin [Agrobacterium rubi]NTF36212.1 type II toxin-antitoxin system PemK/MazF family toxin [Agrobacterium rubi]OCJ54621.1 growth inhibitor PemK [Agrobacterium rubi]QTG01294.1 type II toxin-antitoxin system PemK/MazF family toxin [Agrobacterium rubi]